MKTKHILLMMAMVLLVFPAGCLFSPDDNPDVKPIDNDLEFADTREQLMENFQIVYEKMDIDDYIEVIDENFRIYLSDDTRTEYGLPREYFDYDEEVQITRNMFSGNAIDLGNGETVPGISEISFKKLIQIDAWRVSPADDRIANADFAPFEVEFEIARGGFPTLEIRGMIEFYLVAEEIMHQGRLQDRWKMVGQVDYTAVEN